VLLWLGERIAQNWQDGCVLHGDLPGSRCAVVGERQEDEFEDGKSGGILHTVETVFQRDNEFPSDVSLLSHHIHLH
jgi:hypothetical protein